MSTEPCLIFVGKLECSVFVMKSCYLKVYSYSCYVGKYVTSLAFHLWTFGVQYYIPHWQFSLAGWNLTHIRTEQFIRYKKSLVILPNLFSFDWRIFNLISKLHSARQPNLKLLSITSYILYLTLEQNLCHRVNAFSFFTGLIYLTVTMFCANS